MIPLWYASTGESFKIEKYTRDMPLVTSERMEFRLKAASTRPLPVIGKEKDVLYIAFAGKRFAIEKGSAMQIFGNITGKTKGVPKIMAAPAPCLHDCSKCSGCNTFFKALKI